MWDSVDSVGPDKMPIINNNQIYVILYIILIVLICLLFLNLFVGVIMDSFNSEKEKLDMNYMLKKTERAWMKTQIMCYESQPTIRVIEDEPEVSAFRNSLIKLSNSPGFDYFIMACIVGNTIVLATHFHNMPVSMIKAFEVINYVFMFIFTIEAIIKLVAMKVLYFKDNWNLFDFIVVVLTAVVLALSFIPGNPIDLKMQATLIRVLRILRVLRIIKRLEKL
jgi:voltage-dependent calcium channel L type alpha-1D